MRILMIGSAVLTLAAAPALAAENFIPLGQNYAPGQNDIPALGSAQDRINAQVDIYETEIYNRDLREKLLDSRLNQLSQDTRNQGDDFRDY
jgi:hypothetical protein